METDVDTGRSIVARLKGAAKSYGKVRALDGVDLTVTAGEVLAVLGPNGAGKTTAISLMLGLLKADSGEVDAIRGRSDIADRAPPHRRDVADRRRAGHARPSPN